MAVPNRPTAQDIERLSDAFRKNPGSPAFVELGMALLALGRPRDAIEVGARGLKANPLNTDGRLMVARAFAAQHQWKEAQAELLKIVKADRNHASGFRLLGEVLLRRGDFQRALPVLQHAQNLNPTDPSILGLLRHARTSQSLPPPPPPPTPMAPAATGAAPPPVADLSQRNPFDDMPTRVADDQYGLQAQNMLEVPTGALGRMELERQQIGQPGPAAPVERPVRASDGRGDDHMAARPVQVHQPPPVENPLAPLGESGPVRVPPSMMPPGAPAAPPSARTMISDGQAAPPQQRPNPGPAMMPPPRPTGPMAPRPGMAGRPSHGMQAAAAPLAQGGPAAAQPQPGQPRVRPRLMPLAKPKEAARASLKQSAAVGEQYLNNLLMGGLLDVPNVRVGELTFDVTPDRKWGRSTTRMFIYLFTIAIMGVAGAGTWYWYSEKQKSQDVERHLAKAKELVYRGSYKDVTGALDATRSALKRDPGDLMAIAVYAEASGINTLLFGEIPPGEVRRAVDAIKKDVNKPGDEGYRELLIARTAMTLATLDQNEADASVKQLRSARKELSAWLTESPDDLVVRWLDAKALLSSGDLPGAKAAYEQAYGAGKGPAIAGVEWADRFLDEGEHARAIEIYDEVLKSNPEHTFAFLGRAMANAEQSRDSASVMSDINVGIAQAHGKRIDAYSKLALAEAQFVLEDYEGFRTSIGAATGVTEPRFLSRVAYMLLEFGEYEPAARARTNVRWYTDVKQENRAKHPVARQFDAALEWHVGDDKAALTEIGKQKGLRGHKLRGKAQFDLRNYTEATAEFDAALEIAPDDLELQVWKAATTMITDKRERKKADEELDALGRQAKSKAARYPHAVALLAVGRTKDARKKLELSLDEITNEYPNPLEYRCRALMATIDTSEGKIGDAVAQLEKALEHNGAYLPAQDLLGQLLVDSQKARAAELLGAVIKTGLASPNGEVAFARAVMPSKNKEVIEAARAALERAKKKGAAEPLLQQAIPLVDESLFDKLGVRRP